MTFSLNVGADFEDGAVLEIEIWRLIADYRQEWTIGRGAIHPGEHLAEKLEALEMSAAELNRKLEVPADRITEMVTGRRAISGFSTLRPGPFFRESLQFRPNVQSLYDLPLAKRTLCDAIRSLPTLSHSSKEGRNGSHLRPAWRRGQNIEGSAQLFD